MSPLSKHTRANLVPCLRYRDLAGAIGWLEQAFGFEPHQVYEDEQLGIIHAQMLFGSGMIMLGPTSDSAYGRLLVQPDQAGGRATQTTYVIVASADALYTRAKAAGADIVLELKNEDYGGRSFTCRDPEGHVWTFGTYDPWADPNREENR